MADVVSMIRGGLGLSIKEVHNAEEIQANLILYYALWFKLILMAHIVILRLLLLLILYESWTHITM